LTDRLIDIPSNLNVHHFRTVHIIANGRQFCQIWLVCELTTS